MGYREKKNIKINSFTHLGDNYDEKNNSLEVLNLANWFRNYKEETMSGDVRNYLEIIFP